MPLRRSSVLIVTVVVISLAGGIVALAPTSSGQSPGAAAPTCKQSKARRLPIATGVTIYAAPNPATAARQVTVFGQLVGLHKGVSRCGIAIELWRRYPAQHRFSPIGRTFTNAAGTYSFLMAPGSVATNRDWLVTAPGLTSRTVAEHVRPTVTLASTATFAIAGDVETLSGQLEPGLRGEVVSLQRRVGRSVGDGRPAQAEARRKLLGRTRVHHRPHRAMARDGPVVGS